MLRVHRWNWRWQWWAIFRKRTTVLSELARCFVRPRRHIHRLKRIWRFVSNLRFNFQAVMDAICLHNLAMVLWASGRRVGGCLCKSFEHKSEYASVFVASSAASFAVVSLLFLQRRQHDSLSHSKSG